MGFISSYTAILQPITEGSQARTHAEWELIQRSWISAVPLFAPDDFLSLISLIPKATSQGDGTAHNQRDRPSHVITTEDNTQAYYLQDNLVGMIFQGRLPLLK